MDQNILKQQVAAAAIEYITPHLREDMIIGVGTGSTANCFIDQLAALRHRFDGTVASSEASAERLKSHGIPVYDLNSAKEMPFYIDGADETNAQLELIKGGGAALTREKIVASVAREFICIADESKLVQRLGKYPLPVEVIPMARSAVARTLVQLGGTPAWREGVTTDNGNIILDVYDLNIVDAPQLESAINDIPGVVTNGLFAIQPASVLLLAGVNGVQKLTR